MFPILLSAPSKTHFFVRSDDDRFEIDLDRVNSGEYSPLKLHRVSFFVDVGHDSGSPMGFGFDGSMLVAKSPTIQNADDAVDYFNNVKAALTLGGLPMEATTESMIGSGELKETGYFRYRFGFGAEAEIARAFQEGGAGNFLNIKLLEPPCVSEEQVIASFESGEKVLRKLGRLNAAFLAQAFTSLPKGEARNCLIFGWVACEQVVEQIWQDIFLSEKKYFLTTFRRKSLSSLQNVSQKIDTLFQSGIIDETTYEHSFYARKARNDFAHKGGAVSQENASRCLSALIGLINVVASKYSIPFDSATTILAFASTTVLEKPKAEPKAWRALYKIPGDPDWVENDEKVDGHQVGRVETSTTSTHLKPPTDP